MQARSQSEDSLKSQQNHNKKNHKVPENSIRVLTTSRS